VRDDVDRLSRSDLDVMSLIIEASEVIGRALPFDRTCWHTVDPGTMLFTGSVNRNLGCSGTWLAEHEYVIEDVNKWWFLARSGRCAGATSMATHGDLARSARHRSHEAFGIGDELRVSFVSDGVYWGAAGFLRDADQPWFAQDDVELLVSLSPLLARSFRRAMVTTTTNAAIDPVPVADGPGVIVFDEHGVVEAVSPAAERWVAELREEPKPAGPAESSVVRSVAARARTIGTKGDPLELAARARVQTATGEWLLIYGTPLSGAAIGRVAVVIQPATPNEVAPLMALAYGLTDRETEITRLCMQGRSTKEIAATLFLSAYTVQDHLKAVFHKTGVHARSELVGQIFLEHYVTRWEPVPDAHTDWLAFADPHQAR
jgi:DNA-binding CsgD family transcriptional regulator